MSKYDKLTSELCQWFQCPTLINSGKIKQSGEILELSKISNQIYQINIYRTFYPNIEEYTIFSVPAFLLEVTNQLPSHNPETYY